MTVLHITPTILAACDAIVEAGHGVELEKGEGGSSHTTTFITICCRQPGSQAFTKRLTVKYTSAYGGKFHEFQGESDEFGEWCHYAQPTIAPFVEIATRIA